MIKEYQNWLRRLLVVLQVAIEWDILVCLKRWKVDSINFQLLENLSTISTRVNDGSFTSTKGNRALDYPKLHLHLFSPSFPVLRFSISPHLSSITFRNFLPSATITLSLFSNLKYFDLYLFGCAMKTINSRTNYYSLHFTKWALQHYK